MSLQVQILSNIEKNVFGFGNYKYKYMRMRIFCVLLGCLLAVNCNIFAAKLQANQDYLESLVQNSRQYLNDVVLSHEIPPIFVMGEVFRIQGFAKERKVREYRRNNKEFGAVQLDQYPVTVFFLNKWTKEKQFYFTQKVYYGQYNFSIQCYLNQPGKYYIGIFVGLSGVYYPKIYQIKKSSLHQDSLPHLSIMPENLTLALKNNEVMVSWRRKTPLTRIIFIQPQNQINFTVSNDEGIFKIPYAMFQTFHQGEIQISIMHADSEDLSAYRRNSSFSKPVTKKIKAAEHHFREVKKNKVQIEGELAERAEVNETITIRGKWKEYILTTAYVLEPDNYIRIIRVKMDLWRKTFEFKMKARKQGVYIIEINHHKGYAVINSPLYVGDGFPILPDFQDLTPVIVNIVEMNSHIPQSLEGKRKYILNLINSKRKSFATPSVQLDDELNELAQRHSDDMATHRYVSHRNRQRAGASQRAKDMGITTKVKENIASCYSIDYCQNGLNRSPAHLNNIIKGRWARVGIGIAQDNEQAFYITQQFSTIDPNRKRKVKNDINSMKEAIIEEFSFNGGVTVVENKRASQALETAHERYGFSWALALMDQTTNRFGVRRGRKIYLSMSVTGTFIQFLISRGYFHNNKKYKNICLSLKIVKTKIQLLGILY